MTASDDISPDRDGGLLSGLLGTLRLPERVVTAIESVAAIVEEDVRPMREDVVAIRRQSSDLSELLPTLEGLKADLGGRLDGVYEVVQRLEGVESHLDARVGELCEEISAMHATVSGLKQDVQRITDRLPDPNTRGPLEKARDVLTGGD